jgi:hypothetical protein
MAFLMIQDIYKRGGTEEQATATQIELETKIWGGQGSCYFSTSPTPTTSRTRSILISTYELQQEFYSTL